MNRPYVNYSDEELDIDITDYIMRLHHLIIFRDFDVKLFKSYSEKLLGLEEEREYRKVLIQ